MTVVRIELGLFAEARPSASPRTDTITGRTYLERGAPVMVLVRWSGQGPRNVLIQRPDGTWVVRAFQGLRRTADDGAARVSRQADRRPSLLT
jgi:hypothetical protein